MINLAKEKEKLTFKELNLLLVLIVNPFVPEHNNIKMLTVAVDVILNIKYEFFELTDNDLHKFFANFSKVLNKISSMNLNSSFNKLADLLEKLTEKYAFVMYSSNLLQQVDGFASLSTIAVKGFHLSENTKNLLTTLFNKLDKNVSKLSDVEMLYFTHAINSLGILIDLDTARYTELLVEQSNKILSSSEFEVKSKIALLWSLLVFRASRKKQLDRVEKKELRRKIKQLYENIDKKSVSELASHTLILAQSWLKLPRSDFKCSKTVVSQIQNYVYQKLRATFPHLNFEKEYSINNLSPCDIAIPDKAIAIEVQGLHHYLDKARKIQTGATILKIELLKREKYTVIEVHVGEHRMFEKSIKNCIKEIEALIAPSKIKF